MLGVIDFIALPKASSPLGTTLILTFLLGDVTVRVASTVEGTISTSTTLPYLSYATNLTLSTVLTPALGSTILSYLL